MRTRFTMLIITGLAAVVLSGCSEPAKKKPTARVAWDKSSVRAKLPVAQQQYASGKYQDALKTLNEVFVVDKDNAAAHLLTGKILMAEGLSSRGLDEIKEALRLDATLHEGWFIQGAAAEEAKDMARADEMYRRALNADPANASYAIALASVEIGQGKYQDAQKLLDEKIAMSPGNADLKLQAAQLLQRQGKTQEAISQYRQARQLRPDDAGVAEALGYCYVLAGSYQEAADVLGPLAEKCSDEQKKSALIEMLAMCDMNTKQYSSAEKNYSKLAVAQRENPQAWLRMGQAALGAGSASRAYTCSQRALALQDGFGDAIALQACSEFMSRDYAAAARSFERVAGDKEHGGFAWLMIGKCHSRMGNAARAKEAYERARACGDPEMVQYLAKIQN